MSYTSRLPKIAAELALTLDTVAEAGAEMVAARARDRVPVQTGKLRDAIHVEREGRGEYAVIAGDSDAFYGHIVEHGSVHTPAQPFLTPAAEETRDEFTAAGKTALRRLT